VPKMTKSHRWLNKISLTTSRFALGLMLMVIPLNPEAQEVFQFRNDVITQVPLGSIEAGRYAFRATITTVAPGAQIPFHVHEFHGLRYMLEGALTIAWKEGHTQTFTQGSTYYEGPGENHPPGVMAASNPLDRASKVLIIELVPLK
jgi:quercetin dioxygenase-like cupin family protein